MENILSFSDNILKIADFGFAKKMKNSEDCNSYLGTRGYMPPEILACKSEQKPYDGKKADIFSLGVILYCMVFKAFPFANAFENDERY